MYYIVWGDVYCSCACPLLRYRVELDDLEVIVVTELQVTQSVTHGVASCFSLGGVLKAGLSVCSLPCMHIVLKTKKRYSMTSKYGLLHILTVLICFINLP